MWHIVDEILISCITKSTLFQKCLLVTKYFFLFTFYILIMYFGVPEETKKIYNLHILKINKQKTCYHMTCYLLPEYNTKRTIKKKKKRKVFARKLSSLEETKLLVFFT